jgi:hypothetical protein
MRRPLDERNTDKADHVPAVSDKMSVAELKAALPVAGLNRPMKVTKNYTSNKTPCERAFDRIHNRNGGHNDAA